MTGQPFFRSAYGRLRAGGVNMDVPIAIGVTLALGMSVVETIKPREHAYFDAAIMLLTFLLVRTLSRPEPCGERRERSRAILPP